MHFLSWHQRLADANILVPPFKLNSAFCVATWNHLSKKERLCETANWWKSWRKVWIWMKEIVCFGEVSYQVNIEQLKNRKKYLDNSTFTLFFSPLKSKKNTGTMQYFMWFLKVALWHITFLKSKFQRVVMIQNCNQVFRVSFLRILAQ